MQSHRFLPFAVAFLAAVAASATEPPATGTRFRSIHLPAGHFRCEVPQDWGQDRDEREEARIHYCGVFLYGPREESGLRATLSIRFFAPDNTMFRGAEGYLQRQLGPSLVKPAKEVTSEARDVTVAGQPGKSFTRDTADFFPPDSLDTKEIPVREEYYVVSHLGGFVVIKFAAPTAVFAERRVALQRLLDTLQLLPERSAD